MKTLGLIGGMSWESTALYYKLINQGVAARLGGLHSARLLIWSFDFADIAALQAKGDWQGATARMVDAGRSLKAGGAEALVICTNTMHKMADAVKTETGLPVIHIADATAEAIKAAGLKQPGLLATKFTMEQDFYKGRLMANHGLSAIIPEQADRDEVHRIIYDELCRGTVLDASRETCKAIINRVIAEGADSMILGCTEITMLIGQKDVDVPVFDTTALHASAAVEFALG